MRVLVVGGSSTIGIEVVKAFVRRGDDVIATYAAEKPSVQFAQMLHLDLERYENIDQFFGNLRERWENIDHLVLLAGVLPGKSLAEYSHDLIQKVMSVNFTGQAELIQKLLPFLTTDGSVLIVSSIAAQQGSFDPIYAASKAALIAFTKSLAMWCGKKARFNCIAPGLVENSAMYEAMSPNRRQIHIQQTPAGALLALDDLASVIVDLTEKKWRHLNGAVVSLNGGRFV